jgi:flagellar motor switch protein FliM
MEQVLTQEQIGAFLLKARKSASAVRSEALDQKTSSFDLRQSRQLSPNQTRGISVLHEAWARRIDAALSAYLRVSCTVKLAAVEQIPCSEFLGRFPEPTYLASFRIASLDACALMQMDLPLVFQILDLTLGGFGTDATDARDLTELEEEIFESITQILCQELGSAWNSVLDLDFKFGRRRRQASSARLIPPSEKVLSVNFEVTVGESQGKLNLAFPSVISTALSRALLAQAADSEPDDSQRNRVHLQELMLNSRFETELVLPTGTVAVREVYSLKPGSVVVLQARTSDAIHLKVAGKKMFLATPVGCGSRRGAQIQKVLSIAPDQGGK